MALRFNPPPNWPKPPEGFVPLPGWQPDPSWEPMPEGWQLWVDDGQDDATRPLTDIPEAKAPDEEQSHLAENLPPEHPAPESEAHEKYQQVADTLAQHVAQNSEDPTEVFSTEPTRPLQQDEITQFTQRSQAPYMGNYRGSYAAPSYQTHPAGQQVNPATYQQNPYQNQPKKKGFFSSTAGILTIIGIVLLVFAVLAFLVLGTFFSALSSLSSSSSSSYSSSQETFGSPDSGTVSGEVLEFSGSGDRTIDVSSRNKSTEQAWVEFEFVPEDDSYTSFTMQGKDSRGSSSDLFILTGGENSGTVKGSSWMDAQSYYEPTQTIVVEADGNWTVKIHPISDAPIYGKGDTLSGNVTTAFLYEGDASKAKVKFDSPQDDADNFMFEAFDTEIHSFRTVTHGSGQVENNVSLNFTKSTPMVMDNSFQGTWEISFE